MKRNVFKVVCRAGKGVCLISLEEFPQASWRLSVESIGSANMSERMEQSFTSGGIIGKPERTWVM